MYNTDRVRWIMAEYGSMIRVGEAARMLHVHPSTLRRWSDKGIIRAHHINLRGDRRFKRDDVTRLTDQLADLYLSKPF